MTQRPAAWRFYTRRADDAEAKNKVTGGAKREKLSLLLAALLILSSTVVSAEWETFKSADGMYEYTKDGVITAYYGDEFAFFPAEIDGTKINEIGVMACFDSGIEYISVAEGIEFINTNAF
ncbi:MAG: hypothetical protein L6V93_21590 [Clostridiales bacterium]|nr:MAG: hypothetical protein L6V93_21590 [Clostridiales bacterium]